MSPVMLRSAALGMVTTPAAPSKPRQAAEFVPSAAAVLAGPGRDVSPALQAWLSWPLPDESLEGLAVSSSRQKPTIPLPTCWKYAAPLAAPARQTKTASLKNCLIAAPITGAGMDRPPPSPLTDPIRPVPGHGSVAHRV